MSEAKRLERVCFIGCPGIRELAVSAETLFVRAGQRVWLIPSARLHQTSDTWLDARRPASGRFVSLDRAVAQLRAHQRGFYYVADGRLQMVSLEGDTTNVAFLDEPGVLLDALLAGGEETWLLQHAHDVDPDMAYSTLAWADSGELRVHPTPAPRLVGAVALHLARPFLFHEPMRQRVVAVDPRAASSTTLLRDHNLQILALASHSRSGVLALAGLEGEGRASVRTLAGARTSLDHCVEHLLWHPQHDELCAIASEGGRTIVTLLDASLQQRGDLVVSDMRQVRAAACSSTGDHLYLASDEGIFVARWRRAQA